MDEERSEYYYRLVCLVVDLGTEVLLKVFIKYIPTGDTIKTFLISKSKDVNKLSKRKVLNSMHLSLINMADETKFDISLLSILIRNLTSIQAPNNGWDSPVPVPGDKSPGAFLIKLKNMRNEAVAHRPKAALKRSEFEMFWKDTEEALVELAGEVGQQERAAIQQKIVEAKSKPLLGTENAKLDALLKWDFEDEFSKMASKLDAVKDQIDKQNTCTAEVMSSMQSSLLEIQDQVKKLGIHEAPDAGPSSQLQARQTVTDAVRPENSAEINAMGQQVNNLENILQQFMQRYSCMLIGRLQTNPTESALPPITNTGALSDDEILEYSRELGSDWEIFAIYLGYKQAQIDALKNTYVRQIESLLRVMIEKWHDVVARCKDENPRKLLAAAFSGIRDNLTASKILGDRDSLKEVKKLKPTDATAKEIKKITFETQNTSMMNKVEFHLNLGGHNSVNAFPNSSVSVEGNMNMQSYHSAALGHLQYHQSYDHQPGAAPFGQVPCYPYNYPPPLLPGAAPFGQYPHHQSNYPQPLPPGGAPFEQYPHHQSNYPQPLPSGGGAQGFGYRPDQQPFSPLQPQVVHQSFCRGEGVGDHVDGPIPTNQTSQFSKTRDETLPQNVVAMLNRNMKSVGCLTTPYGRGTAFRVGDRYVITAFHVVTKVQWDMYTKYRQTEDSRIQIPCVYVNFNESLDHPSSVLYRLHPPCFKALELDVAILEIVNPDGFLPCALPLSKTGGPKSKVSIIGYGHPGTNSKHLDPNCPVLAANSDRVVWATNQASSEIIRLGLINPDIVKTSFVGHDDPSRFLLDSFFEFGGSGGPAINHEIPESSEVVGIYVQGFPGYFFDLPKHMQDSCFRELRFEMCTRTSSLYSVLLGFNRELAKSIFG